MEQQLLTLALVQVHSHVHVIFLSNIRNKREEHNLNELMKTDASLTRWQLFQKLTCYNYF